MLPAARTPRRARGYRATPRRSTMRYRDRQLLAGAQRGVIADAIPVDQLRHAHPEHLGDARQRVTATHLIAHLASTVRRKGISARRGVRVQHQFLSRTQRVTWAHAI